MPKPRGLIVAGLSGGSGKSVAAVGLVSALRARQLRVLPFKKGPDYIDAGWLARAAGLPCYNLDPFLTRPEQLKATFHRHLHRADVALVEGNRGLYDGVNSSGSYSTAELAVQLALPVLLVVNCTKTTRTMAALVLGCCLFDPRVRIAGVILNQVATSRHERILRECLAQSVDIPVVGIIPRMQTDIFPMRHLGLTPHQEYRDADEAVASLQQMAAAHFDLDAILGLMQPLLPPTAASTSTAQAAPPARAAEPAAPTQASPIRTKQPARIGVLRDAAFQFYYEENLEALQDAGAELVMINALTAASLPQGAHCLHGLYIGGGFPETSAQALADNHRFRHSLCTAIEQGLPVYAECGGLIYLGRSIVLDGKEYPLTGIFPVTFSLSTKPQAHGYSILRVEGDNSFYSQGLQIKGHEFRYSKVQQWSGQASDLVFKVERGTGFAEGRDGLVYKNVLALYTHVLAAGTPEWVNGFMAAAMRHAQNNCVQSPGQASDLGTAVDRSQGILKNNSHGDEHATA
ncbi:MAG: cobyrinate a,c-diamide synthase [Desulfobulbaceae bacterium]|nr:cobyrinate a,c-diamide synthase [Desulfobulbaceae bacterium]